MDCAIPLKHHLTWLRKDDRKTMIDSFPRNGAACVSLALSKSFFCSSLISRSNFLCQVFSMKQPASESFVFVFPLFWNPILYARIWSGPVIGLITLQLRNQFKSVVICERGMVRVPLHSIACLKVMQLEKCLLPVNCGKPWVQLWAIALTNILNNQEDGH